MKIQELLTLAQQGVDSIKDTLEGAGPDIQLLEDLVVLRTAWSEQDLTDIEQDALDVFDGTLKPYVWGFIPVNDLRVAIANSKDTPWCWWLHELSCMNTESAPELIEVAVNLMNDFDTLKGFATGLLTSSAT